MDIEFFTRAYKLYATFEGRDTRQQFWMYVLFYMLVTFVLAILEGFVGTYGLLGALFSLASFVPYIAITTRRLHDTDKSGWWQLIVIIPIIGFIVLIIFLAQKGTVGENRFGKDPMESVE